MARVYVLLTLLLLFALIGSIHSVGATPPSDTPVLQGRTTESDKLIIAEDKSETLSLSHTSAKRTDNLILMEGASVVLPPRDTTTNIVEKGLEISATLQTMDEADIGQKDTMISQNLTIAGHTAPVQARGTEALASTWHIETAATEDGRYTSLALDDRGYPHISYGGYPLQYAYKDGTGWHSEVVDSTLGWSTSLVLDTGGYPHISYYDGSYLNYAYQDVQGWNFMTVDDAGDVGDYTSMSLDQYDYAHISYYDGDDTSLKYAYRDVMGWHTETVDSGGDVGHHTSLALDEDGYPHISYFDKTDQVLKYAYRDIAGWHITAVDTGLNEYGGHTALTLDESGYPHISYYGEFHLKYAYQDMGGWHTEVVDDAGVVGWNTSIALDSSGHVHISYFDLSNDDLKYAYESATAWDIETVDSAGEVGWDTAIAVDEADQPCISYYDYTNENLKYAYQDSAAAPSPTPDPGSDVLEDFEGTWPASGWQISDQSDTDGGEYLWGKRDCHPHTGTYGGWAVGGGTQGSALVCDEEYPTDAKTWAVYGPFDLSDATSANLEFHLWGSIEGGDGCPYDSLLVGDSIDGSYFSGSVLCGTAMNGDAGNGYYQLTRDLSERLGENQVWIAFTFTSDGSINDIGFTIDDISLNIDTASDPTPEPTDTPCATPTDTPFAPLPTADPGSDILEDFESSWPASGWDISDQSDIDGGEYLWGKRDCHPHTGTYAGWSVGGGDQGSALACDSEYPLNANTWAIYGPFDLSEATSASLEYHLWGITESGDGCPYDYLFVGDSIDSINFTGSRTCGNATTGDAGNGYHHLTHDLSSRLGESRVWIAFVFISDDVVTDIGFTVDDITLNIETASAPSPTPLPDTPTPTRTPTRRPSPTPTRRLGIYGQVTYQGTPIADVPLLLRFYDGSGWSTMSETYTDAEGHYRFTDVPSLDSGQKYYVRYYNGSTTLANVVDDETEKYSIQHNAAEGIGLTGDPDYLYNWYSFDITSYTAGTEVHGGDFDIANVDLDAPSGGVTVELPQTFSWERRAATTSDSYAWRLFDPTEPAHSVRTEPLGYVSSFNAESLLPGFDFDTEYAWAVMPFAPDGGYGYSYYARYVTFERSSTPTPTPTNTPTRIPTSTPTSTPTRMPTAPPSRGIHGRVTYQGEPIAGIPLELQLCEVDCELQATTTTLADGTYQFTNVPSLGYGQEYQIVYINEASNTSALNSLASAFNPRGQDHDASVTIPLKGFSETLRPSTFAGQESTGGENAPLAGDPDDYVAFWISVIERYTAGTDISGGDFDLANIDLNAPAPGTEAELPQTFYWNKRSGMLDDEYYLYLFTLDESGNYKMPGSGAVLVDAGGYVYSYTLDTLLLEPAPLSFGTEYGWAVIVVNQTDNGFILGASYYYRVITFLPLSTMNDYIRVDARSDDGQFVIGTTGGNPDFSSDDDKNLMYGFMEDGQSSPETSFTTIRVSNQWGTTDYKLNQIVPVQPPTLQDDEIVTMWEIVTANVRVIQRLKPHHNPYTLRPDTTLIRYEIINEAYVEQEVGLRALLDVKVGNNDGAPYFVAGEGNVEYEREFVTSYTMPEYWTAFESSSFAPESLKGQGILRRGDATPPDRFIIAHWGAARCNGRPGLYESDWEYDNFDPTFRATCDSAVALYWNPVSLYPGERRTVQTYYGLAGSGGGSSWLELPEEVTCDQGLEFNIQLWVNNDSGTSLTGGRATLNLPPGLRFAYGETADKDFPIVGAGTRGWVEWVVVAERLAEAADVAVNADLEFTNRPSWPEPDVLDVHIPACRVEPPNPPRNLAAYPGPQAITLDWQPSTSSDVTAYNIYRCRYCIDEDDFEHIDTTPKERTAYEDDGLTASGIYTYYVTSLSGTGEESERSNTASARYESEGGIVQLSIPSVYGRDFITVPVNIANATGLQTVDATEIWVNYPAEDLELISYQKAILAARCNLLEREEDGAAIVGLVCASSSLQGAGTLYWMGFRVHASEGTTGTLSFDQDRTRLYYSENRELDCEFEDGTFHVQSGYSQGDANGDGTVDIGDVLKTIRMAAGGDFGHSEEEHSAADLNGDRGISIADESIIKRIWQGLELTPSDSALAAAQSVNTPVNITVGTAQVEEGVVGDPSQEIWLPVSVNSSADIAGSDLVVAYDANLLQAIGARRAGLTAGDAFSLGCTGDVRTDGEYCSRVATPGMLKIAVGIIGGEVDTLPAGGGVLCEIGFTIKQGALAMPSGTAMQGASPQPQAMFGNSIPLAVYDAAVNDTYGRDFESHLQRPVNTTDGQIRVGDVKVYLPVIIKNCGN